METFAADLELGNVVGLISTGGIGTCMHDWHIVKLISRMQTGVFAFVRRSFLMSQENSKPVE